jgi:hypothetical protein
MVSEVLSSVESLGHLPVIGLVISFVLFCGIIIRVIRMDKSLIEKLQQLPLDTDSELDMKGEDHNG